LCLFKWIFYSNVFKTHLELLLQFNQGTVVKTSMAFTEKKYILNEHTGKLLSVFGYIKKINKCEILWDGNL